jgi:predicted phosphate transport protein (TIGR00153 family)
LGRLAVLSWFQALMPREERFFDLFEQHAETVVIGALALRRLLDGGADMAAFRAEIRRQEHAADDITRETLLAVRRTFITPFDRSDIRDLINAMDDAIDQMHQTSKATELYEFSDFNDSMRRIGDLVVQSAELTAKSLPLLRMMNRNAAELNAYAEEITKLEDEADSLHDQGLKELLHRHRRDDPMAFVIGAQIYDHLEKVVDGFENVANRVTGVVIEHS